VPPLTFQATAGGGSLSGCLRPPSTARQRWRHTLPPAPISRLLRPSGACRQLPAVFPSHVFENRRTLRAVAGVRLPQTLELGC